jgi:ATP-dependent helicase/nuclease subunit A
MDITIYSASAGTGKTYTLAKTLTDAIVNGKVRADAVIAITYTNKAAAELGSRLRANLLAEGQTQAASQVRDAYMGSVHSVCQRLLGELAFEQGYSPFPETAPAAHMDTLFREELAVVSARARASLETILKTWCLEKGYGPHAAPSWSDHMNDLVDKAALNNLDAAAIQASLSGSLEEMLSFLPTPMGDADARDGRLLPILIDLSQAGQAFLDGLVKHNKKIAGSDRSRIQQTHRLIRKLENHKTVSWKEVVGVPGNFPPRKFPVETGEIEGWINAHLSHPRFHAELSQLLETTFGEVAGVAQAFRDRKKRERVISFDDMLDLACRALRSPASQERLRGRFDLLMVDEFQDTSPVQLEVILALSKLAKRTVWVGDRKQAIYGFQGADPALMKQAADSVLEGKALEVLPMNYRSRPPLVGFCSTLFSAAFAAHGFSNEEVAVEPACPEPPALATQPALHCLNITWDANVDPKAKPKPDANESWAIARMIKEVLEQGTLIVRERNADPIQVAETHLVQPQDIAVLARKNKDCAKIARAIRALGIPAEVSELGLEDAAATALLRAGLALLADPKDGVAAAELGVLTGGLDQGSDWLSTVIEQKVQDRVLRKTDPKHRSELPFNKVESVERVRTLSAKVQHLSPAECVDQVFGAIRFPEIVMGWANSQQHMANLQALRLVAVEYEDTCRSKRSAASISGLVQYLNDLKKDTPQGLPASGAAVRVSTYHKAKGLEWPVVICASLDSDRGPSAFGVRVHPAENFDATAPLAGRTIRWLPYPYGKTWKNIALYDTAAESEMYAELAKESDAEAVRLLYVAFTRARDHLVFVQPIKGGTPWIDRLTNAEGEALLTLPWGNNDNLSVKGRDGTVQEWPCTQHSAHQTPPSRTNQSNKDPRWFQAPISLTERSDQAFQPSSAVAKRPVNILAQIDIGGRMDFNSGKHEMNAIGNAIHAFIAADLALADGDRKAVADEILADADLADALSAELLLETADRLKVWLASNTVGAALPEWPVHQHLADGRLLSGEIDLLSTDSGGNFVIVDHKSFPGNQARLEDNLPKWSGQLEAYAEAVRVATGREVSSLWIHLPIRGEMVRVG